MSHIREVEELGGMAKAIEKGIPKLRIEEAAAKTQARIDSGTQTVVGVNKFKPESEEAIDVLKVDNAQVRAAQIDKLNRLREERSEGETQAALDALTKCAETGDGNLLDLAVKAARAKATVGEISLAMYFDDPMTGSALIATGVVLLLLGALVITTLSAILRAGLYIYAVEGEMPLHFDSRLVRSAFD